ncbi:MAG: prolipoprotein diacylglyceryl transferase [Chloroflexi bacterium]|nr:prolipoprotein diacylglyceryl transferase [Chloroflexota bacterium]
MQPVLTIILGDRLFAFASYSTLMYLAAAVGLSLGLLMAARRGLPLWRVAICALLMVLATPIGARLLDATTKTEFYAKDPGQLLALHVYGFSFFGGMLLALLVGWASCRVLRLDVRRMADTLTPALGVSIALMRVGCFLAGCSFGEQTDLPWGVVFPRGSDAHIYQLTRGVGLFFLQVQPVHPTQLYEAAAGILAAALAMWLLRRNAPDGTAFLAACAWFAAFRELNHFLRVPGSALTTPDWFYPGLYAAIFAFSLGILLLRHTPAALTSRSQTLPL